jgi:hypothetical protein
MSFALAIRAKSLFIIYPINGIKWFIKEIALGFEPAPMVKPYEVFNSGC